MGTAELAFYNSLWEQAASEGISSFVASGANGSSSCDGGFRALRVGPCCEWALQLALLSCVGGTEFNESATSSQYKSKTSHENQGAALGYIPERVWNQSGSADGSGLWASGGGISTVYSQPTWQQGVAGTSAANGMRAVPDVSLAAASNDGYSIYENGAWWSVAGTSAASPSFAGMMALVNQATGGAGQGNANPMLYSLLNGPPIPSDATAARKQWHPRSSRLHGQWRGLQLSDRSGLGGWRASGERVGLCIGRRNWFGRRLHARCFFYQRHAPHRPIRNHHPKRERDRRNKQSSFLIGGAV